MSTDDDKRDPTVKQLLERSLEQPLEELVDAATKAELEKWFGLPSFDQVEAGEAPGSTEDPDIIEVRERRQRAIAAVDPALLEAHRRRIEPPDDLLKFREAITLRLDQTMPMIDLAMIDNRMSVAEPREVERPQDIEDHLAESTPQALLRDLHRPDLEFEKTFEMVDPAEEDRIDAVAEVRTAIRTSWKLPPLEDTPGHAVRAVIAELRAELRSPWIDIPKRATLPNRRVTE